ncbi:hypothetical protein Taro_052361 [Colocasia esculenta]|uniref:Ubiquitin-conjugating enzyme E2 23 n=1 Tax=Colocasia esculenta TaxID=4460 RepID=A0A843XI90_COLES|nr:hypothetical protein [Colocasia esculenta]
MEYGEGSKIAPMECEPGCGISIAAKEIPGSGSTVKLQESSANLPKEAYVYRQDIVRCNQYEDMLGVVLEVAGDSDSEGDDVTDVSDAENDEGNGSNDNGGDSGNNENDSGERNESLTDGQVRVMWIDGSETTNNLSDISVVDREFLHGDIVASLSNPTGQLGLVVDVNISVDLLSSTGEMIKNVSSRNLKRVRDFTSGDYVVCGPWLGRVDDVLDNVTVLFDDGSLCKVMKADPLRLKPVSKSIIADAGFPYYPGQRVRAVSSSVFKTSRWLSGLWKASRLEGTVTKVQAASVFVYWIASASPGTGDSSAVVPSEEQNPKNLTLLTCFTHANWQLGDWCLLPTSQLPLSSSTDNSTIKNAEDSSRECRPEIDYSMDHVHDDTNFVTECAEASDQAFHVPIIDLKDEKESDVTYPSEVVQDEDCKFDHSKPANSLDKLVSSHLGNDFNASSRMTDNSKVAYFSCENKVLTCPDRKSDSGLAQVADIRNPMIQSGSSLAPSNEPAHESCPAYRKKLRKVLFRREKKAHKKEEPFERAYFIANTITKVDVAWQDGSRELNLESKSLIPMQSPGDHEFFPEQYVVEKASNESDDAAEVKRVGIIRCVDAKERTANVRWLKPVSRPEDPREFDNDEVVSAYELAEHPDYDYCYGDLVVRLSPFSIVANDSIYDNPVEREDHVDLPQVADEMSAERLTCEMTETLNDETDPKISSLSWVGHITGLEDGDIEVTWADGMVSRVGPQAIYVVGREDGESFNGGSEVSDDGASWETVEENEMGALDVAEGADFQPPTDNVVERDTYTAGPSEDSNPVCNESLSIPLAALGFFTRLATGFFSRGRKEMDSSYTDEGGLKQTESQDMQESSMGDTVVDEHSSHESDVLDDLSAQTSQESGQVSSTIALAAETKEKVEDNLDNHTSEEMDVDIDCQRAVNEHGSCSFKHFDIAKDPFDHHFLSENGQIPIIVGVK